MDRSHAFLKVKPLCLLTPCLLALLLLLSACSTQPPKGGYRVMGENYFPLKSSEGFTETGIASWYGKKFHGRLTANGEKYDMYGRSGAHKTLPFGTVVRVTNLSNGRTADVRINDRGPFVHGRIIDLTHTLANELGFMGQGTAKVRLEALGSTKPQKTAQNLQSGNFTWQVGSFSSKENAKGLAAKLSNEFSNARVTEALVRGSKVYRVQVGKYSSRGQADGDGKRLDRLDFKPFLVALN
jgi:rare lipoprotein A